LWNEAALLLLLLLLLRLAVGSQTHLEMTATKQSCKGLFLGAELKAPTKLRLCWQLKCTHNTPLLITTGDIFV
jgi:hypothetical protein